MTYEIVKYRDNPAALTTPVELYKFEDHTPQETTDIAKAMIEAVYKHNGIGIAANQVGLPWAIIAMRGEPADFVCFNPRIAMHGAEIVKLEEACLSFPGLVIPVKRSKTIRVRFADIHSEVKSFTYTGITARVFQHEINHLQGKMFFEGCSRIHLERAIRQAKKRGFDYSDLGLFKYAAKS